MIKGRRAERRRWPPSRPCLSLGNFVQIFLLNPNFLFQHRNRYSEGDGDGQKTPRGHSDFHSHVKNNVFSYSRQIGNFCAVKEYNQFLCCTPESKSVEFSGKHSFTLHPSLDPYGQNHRRRDTYTRCAWAGGTFFPVVLLSPFLVLAGNRFWFYILTYAT